MRTSGLLNFHKYPVNINVPQKTNKITVDEKKENASPKILYFAFGTRVNGNDNCGPNFAVILKGKREKWIVSSAKKILAINLLNELCEFLYRKEHKGYDIIAHDLRMKATVVGDDRKLAFKYGVFQGLRWLFHS